MLTNVPYPRANVMRPAMFLQDAERRTADPLPDAVPSASVGVSLVAQLPTVLILSVSAGAGHVRAAQALCAAADASIVNAVHIDVMTSMPHIFRCLATDAYVKMVGKYPQAWGWLYRRMQSAQPDDRVQVFRRWIDRRQARKFVRTITELKPAAIICTHFLPAELLGYLPAANRPMCPVWVQVTDFDVHRIWIQPSVFGYFAGNEEVAFRLRDDGVAAASIHVTGLPVMPAFAAPQDRARAAVGLGLDPSRPTVLMMGGGAGLGNFAYLATRLLAIDPGLQLMVLTGRNVPLLQKLAKLAAATPERFIVHGHTSQVEQFMACADLIVTKPGGLTSAECLAAGLPMVANAPIPGQEERNADYLVEQGVAVRAIDAVGVEFQVRQLLADPDRLARMAACGRAIAKPSAAADVMQTVLKHLYRPLA